MAVDVAHPWHDPEGRTFAPARVREPYVCYVSAACLEARGLADEEACYEVMLLRLFVREYVEKLREGAEMVADYREKAPEVTRAIEHHPDRREIYLYLYERAIAPCVEEILHGRWEEAHEIFERMRGEVEGCFLRGGRPHTRDAAS